ncbi:MAG: Ig-like domain-containing protein [Pseudomonadota bacterium]
MALEQTNSVAPFQNIDLASPFAPPLPYVGSAADDAGDILGSIAHGGITDDRQPDFSGRGTPGSTIVVRDNGTEIGTTEVNEDGNWSFTPSTDLIEGLHAITIVTRDDSGNESAPSLPFNFEIDVTPPDASRLAITGVADTVGGITGNVAHGGTTDDTRPLLSGYSTGVPGHTVTVMVKDATGMRELGQATIDENGQWTFQVDAPLAAGPNTFTLVERDAAGNETMPTGRYTVTVITDKPTAPVIDSVFDDVGEPHMLQPGEATNDARPTLAGTAQANHTVKFYDGATYLGKAVADESGQWTFTPLIDLPDGTYNVTATSTSPLGQTSGASSAWNFVVDTVAPILGDATLTDDAGKVTGSIASGDTTDDNTPTFGGKTEPHAMVIVYDNGVEIDRVFANDAGEWSFTPKVPLADGAHSFSHAAVDVAGNASAPGEAIDFTVDTHLPTARVTSIGKDSGFKDDDFLTNDGSAGRLIRGSLSEPLAADQKVEISTDGGKTWSGVVMLENGAWLFVDPNSYTADWTIQTRVNGALGSSNITSQDVQLDLVPLKAPNSYDLDSTTPSQIVVDISDCGATVGDRVHVIHNEIRIEYVLTEFDLMNPKKILINVNGLPENPGGLMVGLIDKAGNISDYRVNYTSLNENFSTAPVGEIGKGKSVDIGTMTIKNVNGLNGTTDPYYGYGVDTGIGRVGNFKLNSASLVVYGGYLSVDLKGKMGTSLSGILFDAQTSFSGQEIRFYDENDKLIHTEDLHKYANIGSTNQINGLIKIKIPGGKKFSRFEFDAGNDYIGLDDISIVVSGESIASAGQFQTIGIDSHSVYGGESSNVFDLSNVSYLNKADAGIHGGSGSDTLKLTGSAQVLDLTAIAGRIDSVEIIDLTGTGNNTLKLSLAEVLENGGKNLFVDDGRVQMKVLGNSGDTVDLGDLLNNNHLGYWSKSGQVTLSGVAFDVYQHSGLAAEVLVQQGVTVKLGVGTSVTIDGLGKDSGTATDFVTADGSAGRVVTGGLSGALASGMKVQVSVDGGKTWQDAVVNGKTWAFVDTHGHSGDWRVQVRISDGQGHSGAVVEREVTLVEAAEAPSIVRIPDAEGVYTYAKAQDGSQVLLSLAGTGAKAGDTVHIQWGMSTHDQVLTQLDINSGIATINVPSTVTYSYQGYAKDFAVTAQIVGKDGAIGAVSNPYQVVGTFTTSTVSDTLQKAPVGDVYTGTGFKVTTTGSLSYKAATTTTLAGLTLNDTAQANALFTLDKPANYFTLRLTGIDNAMGAQIQVFDVKGNLIHTENFIGGTDARHTKTFTYTSAELVDIGSFKVISLSPSVTLDAFSQQVVNHVAETRDPNLIEYAPETFYGGTGNDVVSLSVSATTYFNQATAGIHGGSGIDTLKLEGYAHVLDLTKIGSKLSSIEVIDITGNYYNTLTLSLAEVLNNGGVDLFYKGDKSRVQMMVKGNADDTLNLSDLLAGGIDQGDWVKKVGVVTLGGIVYDGYQHSSLGAELLVQQGVVVKVTNSTLVGAVGTFEAPSDAAVGDLPDDGVLSHSTQGYTHGDDTIIAKLGFADRLSGGAGNDTFMNVGTGDTVHGGSGDDTIRINSGDFARVDGGLGIDTLVMDGKAMHIDLSAFGLKIQGIEKFDLGAGGNTLALHASDVLAGGARDMVMADGKVQMLVNGANGDVNLLGGDDSWTQGASATVSGVTYSVYTNLAGTAELLVEDKVHVTIL